MSTTFTSSLDGTNGSNVTADPTTGGNSGFHAKTGTWTFDTGFKAEGTASAKLVIANGTGALMRTHSPAATTRYYDICGAFSGLDGGDIEFAWIRLGATRLASLRINSAGKLVLRDGNVLAHPTTATSDLAIATGQFFRVQWGITGSTQSARLWVSSTLADLFNLPAMNSLTGAFSGGSWDSFRIGCNIAHTLTAWFDRVVFDDATWPTSGGSGNIGPTANAGTDTTADGGETIALNGSGTDPDGTIASYAWSHVSGPAGTFSATNVEDPNWTAPSVTAVTDVVLGLRVTDDDGAQSPRNTVTVTVSPGTVTPTDDFFELFNVGPHGAAVSTSNVDMDLVDTGITFTNNAIGEGTFAVTGTPAGGVKAMTHNFASLVHEEYTDFVYQLDQLTGGPWYIARIRAAGVVRGSIRVNADGTVQVRNGTTASVDSTAPLVQPGVPFRVAWHLNGTVGVEIQHLRIYTGANLWGTAPDDTIQYVFDSGGGDFDTMSWGNVLAGTGTWVLDSVRVDAADWPASLGAVSEHSNLWEIQADATKVETPFSLVP